MISRAALLLNTKYSAPGFEILQVIEAPTIS
jgi:hypothetical protein